MLSHASGHRLADIADVLVLKRNRRPKGRRTGCAPFFDAAGCRIEKSRPSIRWQIRFVTESFLWFLDSTDRRNSLSISLCRC
ncbi:hypothetical protein QUA41_31465, partial [Microcoleus sp. Pol11C1]